MKKLKNYLLIISVLLFVQSCIKKDNFTNQQELKNESKKTIMAFSNLNNYDAIYAYQALTDDEIRTFWIEHVNAFISTRTLNTDQANSINSLMTYLQNADFNDLTYRTDFLSVWLPNALSNFNEQEVFVLAFSIFDNVQDDIKDKNQVIAPGGSHGGGGGGGTAPPKKSCQCEVGSNFWACALNPTQCVKTDCFFGSKGCGFLLLSSCDGRCNVAQ